MARLVDLFVLKPRNHFEYIHPHVLVDYDRCDCYGDRIGLGILNERLLVKFYLRNRRTSVAGTLSLVYGGSCDKLSHSNTY